MLFCAACQSKSCAARMDQTQTFPKGCPGQGEKMDAWLQEYDEPLDRLMAQKSALCSPDHSECRLAKTMRFPAYYGANLDALADCLGELGQGVLVVLVNPQAVTAALGDYGSKLIALFEELSAEPGVFDFKTE